MAPRWRKSKPTVVTQKDGDRFVVEGKAKLRIIRLPADNPDDVLGNDAAIWEDFGMSA